MAKLTITTFLTLDGVMQAPGGPNEDRAGDFQHGGWLVPHADEDMLAFMLEVFGRADAFLLGRGTYDIFASHWPKVSEPDLIAEKLNGLPKYVATRTRTELSWGPSSVVSDLVPAVRALKQKYAGEVQVHGSAGLLQTLLAHDLVDDFHLLTFPVVIGMGKRLFGTGAVPTQLVHQRSRTTPRGTVISSYRRGGPITTGSFALET